jgi:hypothetical protein
VRSIHRRSAEKDVDRSVVGPAEVFAGSPDGHVVETVAVEIAAARHGPAETVVAGFGGQRDAQRGVQAVPAEEQVGAPRIRGERLRRSDHDVIETVVVYIAGPAHRPAELVIGHFSRHDDARRLGRGIAAVIDAKLTAPETVGRMVGSPNGEVVEGIAVEIEPAVDREAELTAALDAGQRGVAHGVHRAAAIEQVNAAPVGAAGVARGGSDREVVVDVVVVVAEAGHGTAEHVVAVAGGQDKVRHFGQVLGAAEVDVDPAGVGSGGIVRRRPDGEVLETVTVQVAHAAEGGAKKIAGQFAREYGLGVERHGDEQGKAGEKKRKGRPQSHHWISPCGRRPATG